LWMSREYVLEVGDRRVRGSTLRVGATYLNGRGERDSACGNDIHGTVRFAQKRTGGTVEDLSA
jgi:hypothetical protein